jgi:hypothetical protein
MIGRWLKLGTAVRPWMVAVALAAAACGGCSKGGTTTGGDAARAPGGAPNDACEPAAVYGPPICTEDEDCRGPGREDWICNPEPMKFDDGCGRQAEWGRICGPGATTGAAPGTPSGAPWPAARTDLPPPLPSRDFGPADE